MTKGRTSLRISNEDIEAVGSFCILGSTTNSKRTSSQEICYRFGTAAMKALEKTFKCPDVSIPTKIKTIQIMVFPVTL